MPVWICAVVGAGVAKAVPGAVLIAPAGIIPPGVEARWQLSQVVDDGMCELTPTGAVAGMTMILLTPTKLLPVTVGPWQATQLFVMPLWLMREPLNLAPLPTGVAVTLEPAPTWHTSHEALVGTWLPGGPMIAKLAAGIAKPATTLAPWHCTQLALVLGALAWMLASVGIAEKSLVVWHAVHWAPVAVGMWFAGFSLAANAAVL